MKKASYLLVGLPGTGKSTFLAALWHVLNCEGVAGSLVLSKLDGDREYITSACENWLGCRKLERTVGIELKPVTVHLTNGERTQDIELFIPDIAGEEYDRIFEERKWPKPLRDFAANAEGIMLFVHPRTVKEPISILEANRIFGGVATQEKVQESSNLWSASLASTQVKLVDILQFICDVRSKFPFKLAIIISAWDLVQNQRAGSRPQTPQEWIDSRLPMLYQFLNSNTESIETSFFGVSAQGGDLELESPKLLSEINPVNRIKVVTHDALVSNDLTLPIKSLI